eukprot:CAMPEP_0181318386 /NCGR_PEP_ID=MMETSP1101-20121128/16977_1 /TAXON_ID=46948 /ORGANISM="Rhodomonas abbreviata, Strain Caron Lab Isolate" /LENGTH=86 /DNA_ID=CAMNT_0023425849 /DNA_START=202 /DNA_END=462 /DNA_ORIENTATION=+
MSSLSSRKFMIFEKLQLLAEDDMFKFPSMHFPAMHFPKFPKFSAKDFAGGQASMSTTEFHCVNGTCNGETVKGSWKTPAHKAAGGK